MKVFPDLCELLSIVLSEHEVCVRIVCTDLPECPHGFFRCGCVDVVNVRHDGMNEVSKIERVFSVC